MSVPTNIVSGAIEIKMDRDMMMKALAELSSRDTVTIIADATGNKIEFDREALRKTIQACYTAFSKDRWDHVNLRGGESDITADLDGHLDNLALILDTLRVSDNA